MHFNFKLVVTNIIYINVKVFPRDVEILSFYMELFQQFYKVAFL